MHNQLIEAMRLYYLVGGLPGVVETWTETKNMARVNRDLKNLIASYTNDFAKHSSPAQYSKIILVWESLARQLAKENKKFTYGDIKSGARAREYEDAIALLQKAGLIIKLNKIDAPVLPLETSKNKSFFKIYLFDIGILRVLAGADLILF